MQSQERQFFNAISYLVFDRSNVSEEVLKASVWPSTVLHCGINCLHGSLVVFFKKSNFPLT